MTADFYVAAPGEVPPPVPAGPLLCDGMEMRVVHNGFLWGYRRAPGLVRTTQAGDVGRSAYVGQWLADLDASLHVHHEGEDTLLWSRLEQRAPACALHVGQMRAQHAQVLAILEAAGPLLDAWRTSADPATGERLAAEYERMLDVLVVHLRREVVEIVPVVEKVLTADEWRALGDHAMGAIPKSRLMPQLGMLLAMAAPADRTAFWRALPRPVRVLFRVAGKRQYARQYRTLFPGEAVPATV